MLIPVTQTLITGQIEQQQRDLRGIHRQRPPEDVRIPPLPRQAVDKPLPRPLRRDLPLRAQRERAPGALVIRRRQPPPPPLT